MATGKQLKAAILVRRAAKGPRKKRTRPEPRQYTVADHRLRLSAPKHHIMPGPRSREPANRFYEDGQFVLLRTVLRGKVLVLYPHTAGIRTRASRLSRINLRFHRNAEFATLAQEEC